MKKIKWRIGLLILVLVGVSLMMAAPGVWAKDQEVCPVMGGKINKDVYTDYQGMRVFFCCPACIDVFKKDPEGHLKKMKEAGVTPEKVPAGGKK
jgi:YHS domain-containing protein